MSQKLPANGFKWEKVCLNFIKTLQKTMMKIVIKDTFLK